jgi:molybdate transport system permease protein
MSYSPDVMIPLLLSLKVAGWATVFATIGGVGVAYVLARSRFPGQDVVDAV